MTHPEAGARERLAAIDVGSNSIRLLVAEYDLQGGLTVGRTTTNSCYANGQPNLDLSPSNLPGSVAGSTLPRAGGFCDVTPSWASGTQVKFGATVSVVDEDTEEEARYQIVGEHEADVKQGRVSITSPIAFSWSSVSP